jgi:hypothetical protein
VDSNNNSQLFCAEEQKPSTTRSPGTSSNHPQTPDPIAMATEIRSSVSPRSHHRHTGCRRAIKSKIKNKNPKWRTQKELNL